ncbi:MAG TPA: hypothetical protein PLU71_01950 [Candidatus Dependentiae bacterium]|nr:hypothetical protein [Candidatus Dependentiae bacterium]HRQ62594.1 hypothetical protein [Candidatus Dependentiae bacterium]
MNHIIIKQASDLNIILNSPVLITGNHQLRDEETLTNMWGISLDPGAVETVSIQDLQKFVNNLILQIKSNNQDKTLYMWFDEMASQLRFNIISGHVTQLPFGCKIDLVHDSLSILKNFKTSSYHEGIPWSEVTIEENMSDDEDDYRLQVFVAYL